VGFGNIWRFPYLVFRNGGAVFLIPYACALFVISVPMYMVETAYGQLIKCKLHHRFSIIHPGLWGLSLAQAIMMFFTCAYYNLLLPWTLYFLYASFKVPLPWAAKEEESGDSN